MKALVGTFNQEKAIIGALALPINVKAVVAAFNQEKAIIGAFSVITNLRMELFGALVVTPS